VRASTAQHEGIFTAIGADANTNIVMLSLPAYAGASAGQLIVLVRRSLGEGGSKHARF
jgi:hypothetical protein